MTWEKKKDGHCESELKALVKKNVPFSPLHTNGINVFVIVVMAISHEANSCDVSSK